MAAQLKRKPVMWRQSGRLAEARNVVIDFILRLATGVRAAVAVVAFGVGGTFLFRLSPYDTIKALLDGVSLPEETITFPDRFAQVMVALDAEGRELYLQFQLWDLLNPILMGIAGTMLLGWLVGRSQRSRSKWRFVVSLPIALLVADLLENGIISLGVIAFPDRAVLGNALPFVTAIKFAAAFATVAAVASLALVWLRDRRSGAPGLAT